MESRRPAINPPVYGLPKITLLAKPEGAMPYMPFLFDGLSGSLNACSSSVQRSVPS